MPGTVKARRTVRCRARKRRAASGAAHPAAIAWNTVRTPTRNTVCRAPDEAVKVPHTDAITSSPPLAC
ncbi:hypothetical protein GQ57_11235 [Burkholderia sp. MSh2]|nr:hypothetical protein GQ57_11235 [Burkholderia sp. MSh2]